MSFAGKRGISRGEFGGLEGAVGGGGCGVRKAGQSDLTFSSLTVYLLSIF